LHTSRWRFGQLQDCNIPSAIRILWYPPVGDDPCQEFPYLGSRRRKRKVNKYRLVRNCRFINGPTEGLIDDMRACEDMPVRYEEPCANYLRVTGRSLGI
jgi:hypothetical protein